MNTAETLLDTVRRRWRLVNEAEAQQRRREQEDLAFQVPENQWTEAAKAARSGIVNGVKSRPERPMLSIDQIGPPLQLVYNQARAAQLGVNFSPVSEEATDETAEVMQGIYRRIERDSNASQARLWAFKRASIAGRGAYRISTKWDEDADPSTFDQEVSIDRIFHQEMVYFDPSAQCPDYRDGEWAIVAAWMPVESFQREFPGKKVPSASDFQGLTEMDRPLWVREDKADKAVLVVEYIYKKHDSTTVEVKGRKLSRDIVTVHSVKLSGCEVLLEEELNGPWIPIVPVLGRELVPFDGERRYVGMVGPAKDGCRLFNASATSALEGMLLEPKAPFIGAVGQFEGLEERWQNANTENYAYLEYNPVTLDGKPIGRPERAQVDGSRMNLALQMMQQAREFIQSTTAIHDPSLGKVSPQEKSGRAILALQQQGDAGTSDFLANLADAMTYEALVVSSLLPIIYDRPGRVTRTLGTEGETKSVMLNAPSMKDPKTGRPVPYKAGPGAGEPLQYNLAEGRYSVSVSIGKSFQTRLQEGGEMLGAILQAHPELVPLIGPTYFQFQDWPGAKEVAKILKKVRDKMNPELADEDQTDSQRSAMEAQQMKAQLQQMGQQLQQAGQIIETKQVEQQAGIQKQQMQEETKQMIAQQTVELEQLKAQLALTIQQMKDATAIEVAQINARARIKSSEIDHDEDETNLALTHGHESREADRKRAHEVAMSQVGAQQAQQQAAQAGAQESEQMGSEQAFSAESAEAEHARGMESAEADRAFTSEQADADRKMAQEAADRAAFEAQDDNQ